MSNPSQPSRSPVGCAHPNELGIEEELAIADGATAQGDWKHAAHHVVGALALDAFSEPALTALRRLHAKHDLLGHLEPDPFMAAHLARAILLSDAGHRDDAFSIVAQVDHAAPWLGTVRLLVDWCDPGPLSDDLRSWATRCLLDASSVGMGRVHLLPGERAALEPHADLAEKLSVGEHEPAILGLISGILRRAGRFDRALQVLDGIREGDSTRLIPLALVRRAAGHPEEAAALFDRAYASSNEPTHLFEKARALGDAKRWQEAIATAQRALAVSGRPVDAELRIFLDWLGACAAGDPGALGRDYDWVRRSSLLHGAILDVDDASTNVLADPRVKRGTRCKIGVSALESPSARMCLALHQGSGSDPREVSYEFAAIPTPDPRIPRGEVATLLWHEVEGVMVQAVAPPSDGIRALVADVARASDDLFSAWDAAARRETSSTVDVEELAHAMVYPSEPPDEVPTVRWVLRTQVAAACLIARSGDGWPGSPRRRVLLDLLHGPGDWVTAATVLVLGEIAVREPDALPEIRRELMALARAIPTGGHCSWAATLAVTAHKVPFFGPEMAAKLVDEWFPQDGGSEDPGTPAPSTAPPPAKRPWWKLW